MTRTPLRAHDTTRWELAARASYIGLIALATLTALHLDASLGDAAGRLWRAAHPRLRARDVVDGLRNVVLFAGLGALWVATSSRPSIRAVASVTGTGALVSLGVETVQLFSPVRTASLLDVTTNTFGTFAGAAFMALVIELMRTLRPRPRVFGVPLSAVAVPYVGAALCEIFTPLFRQERVPDILGSRLSVALSTVAPFSFAGIPWLDFVVLLPAGALIAALMLEERAAESSTAASVWGAVVGTLLVGAAELAHGIGGGLIRSEAVATHTAAVVVGALVGPWIVTAVTGVRSPRRRLSAFLFGYTVLLAMWAWRPFVPRLDRGSISEQLTESHLVPLVALANRVDLFSVGHLTSIFLLFVPLGTMLAAHPSLRLRDRGDGPAAGFAFGAMLACVLEAGHIFLADRTFDVTNALVQVAGVWIGWLISRRYAEDSSRSNRGRDTILFALPEP